MLAAGVPCIPGWHPSDSDRSNKDSQTPAFLQEQADKIGYPVLIKAVSGGGGKGMKIVDRKEDFAGQLESAKREARKHFGDDEVLLERYITRPRREYFLPKTDYPLSILLTVIYLSAYRRRGPDFFRRTRQPSLPL